jgi:hypothetical protein
MSYTEYIKEYKNAQKNKVGPYYMFFIDMKDSLNQLKSKEVRIKYVKFLVKVKEFCEINKTVNFNNIYGHKQGYYMRVGDGVAIMIDIREHDIDKFRETWTNFYSKQYIEFNSNECYVESLDWVDRIDILFYGYAFPFLEDSLKKNRIIGDDHFYETISRKTSGIILDLFIDELVVELGLDFKV